jgi:hypothetical protein
MLTYSIQQAAPLGGTASSTAGLIGREAVIQLQKALRSLAYKKQDPQLDPAKYDGTMTLALVNATKVVGAAIPYAGKAISVIGELKSLLGKIPYGGQVINFILYPSVVDDIFGAVMAILSAFKLGSAASAIKSGVDAAKTAVAGAAAPAAAAIILVARTTPSPSGLSGLHAGGGGLICYNPDVHGPLLGMCCTPGLGAMAPATAATASKATTAVIAPMQITTALAALRPITAAVIAPRAPGTCAEGYYWNPTTQQCNRKATVIVAKGPCPPPNILDPQGNCYDPTGKCPKVGFANTAYGCMRLSADSKVLYPPSPPNVPTMVEWALRVGQYFEGFGSPSRWNAADRAAWEKDGAAKKGEKPFATFVLDTKVPIVRGVGNFRDHRGESKIVKKTYGIFYDGKTFSVRLPIKRRKKSIWQTIWSKIEDIAEDIADIAGDALGFICELAEDVYDVVKKYGCAIVCNDILVSSIGGLASLVATPATGAAIIGGAAIGAAACAAIKVGEALYLIIKLLAFPIKPVNLSAEEPPPDSIATVALPVTRMAMPTTSTAASTARLVMGIKPGVALAPNTSQALLPPPTPAALTSSISATAPEFQWFADGLWHIATARPIISAGLGQAESSSYDVTTAATAVPDVEIVPKEEGERRVGGAPWYRSAKVWIIVGAVGVTAAGATTYYLMRRRSRRALKGALRDAYGTDVRGRRLWMRVR